MGIKFVEVVLDRKFYFIQTVLHTVVHGI